MASKTSHEKYLQKGKAQEIQNKLAQKHQLDLEKDLLRLFQNSLYCDIKLNVDSSSVLTHSCILKTRACRFYKFIYTEFEFFEQNGISIFNIYNASFTHLQSFVENIYTNFHTSKAEDCIIKHLLESKSSKVSSTETRATLKTPDSDLFFTPKSSPSELQKPFGPSTLKLKDNNVASYYKIVSVDDIPLDEKLDVGTNEENFLEKELAEQDELLSSFKTIFSKKTKGKPLGNSSQSAKKIKPKFNRKFECNVVLHDDYNKGKYFTPLWKPNPFAEKHNSLKKTKKNGKKEQEARNSEGNLEDVVISLCGSDMDVSTTGADSGLDNSSICQQETSPREITVSETSGVDLTEAAINEEIPNDETLSTKRSTGSSVSSDAGTWDAGDDLKGKCENSIGRENLNDEEILRLDQMEKNIRDCEIFLYMERQGAVCGAQNKVNHSKGCGLDETSKKEVSNQYSKAINPEELLQGKVDHHLNNYEEENYCNYNFEKERNANDAITSTANLNDVNLPKENEEVDVNEDPKEGASDDLIPSSNINYFTQENAPETKTPPCTPKKLKTEKSEEAEKEPVPEVKPKSWEYNSTGVSNYFIDASSLIDDDEILSPPISLINFKTLQGCEEPEPKIEHEEKDEKVEEEEVEVIVNQKPTVSKKVVTNFFSPDLSEERYSYLREQERRQGDIIFKNSIPHFSKHEVEENQISDSMERLRGGADRYSVDENEQVVPSAEVEDFSPNRRLVPQTRESSNSETEASFFDSVPPSHYAAESPEEIEDQRDGNKDTESQRIPSSRESAREVSSSSECSGSPYFRRRNEATPTLTGGTNFVEDDKNVQKKMSQSQGEAWIVTFEGKKKVRSRFASSDTGSEAENGDERKIPYSPKSYPHEVKCSKKNEPSVEFYIKEPNREKVQEELKSDLKMFPVEKSSSFGYFLDFGKEKEQEIVRKEPEQLVEKKNNMFSMFIGMDENSKPTFSRKSKPILEKGRTFDKTTEENESEPTDSSEVKKPFYMFIESNSPNMKRKQIPKKGNQQVENSGRKSYIRTKSYTIERHPDDSQKVDMECSSSDNSLPYSENGKGNPKEKPPLSKFQTPHEHKIMAWAETKVPNEAAVSSESWLRTKDIQVNYKGKNDGEKGDAYLKKDSTFVMGSESKEKYYDRHSGLNLRDFGDPKPPKRDSGVVLNEKAEESFVKLSDLDKSDNNRAKLARDKMSQSNSECGTKNGKQADEAILSKSTEVGKVTSSFYDRHVNKSLIRLFPNLSLQSLAALARKDGDAGRSEMETSEVSSSLQSSADVSGLEISTSETDVSTHVGGTSRLGEDLLRMFLEEIGPDVVVEVNGRRIKAHKCILTSRCQYFAAKLSGGWVESAGNVISLQRFSYNAVHFALRYIYSGESRIPESLDINELATLADMLCLDGLQEIISHFLKVKYCHSFHVPCSVCSVGVMDCLPIAVFHGLDDLNRKCMRWITKYFVKLWPTKSFGTLSTVLLESCYNHHVAHITVDNVLDTLVNIDKVRGSLPNVRWAENVSYLVEKLYMAAILYIAEHFSSVLTSDNFLALGKESGWNVSLLEGSLIETIRFLPPEQACWSHARLHRILSVATGPNPPPEMDWNEDFLNLLQIIAELVENNLIKQAPRAAKSKAWRQMEPELRSRIQEAACLVLPEPESSLTYRRPNYIKRESHQPNIPQTAKSRNLEIRQIKLAMSQQANRNSNTSRPLSLQIDQRPKKDSRFLPLRPSVSTSSVRKPEPVMEGIRKTQSRSQIIGGTISEPKKTVNPRYSEVKSRYLEPRSPQKTTTEKTTADSTQRRNFRYISSSDSSRNCSPALRPSNSRSSIPQARRSTVSTNRLTQNSVLRSDSSSTLDSKRDRTNASSKSDAPSSKTLSRLTRDDNMSTDSLCTDSLISEKDATLKRKPGKENLGERKKSANPTTSNKPVSNSPMAKKSSTETLKSNCGRKLILPKQSSENKSFLPKRFASGKIPVGTQNKTNVSNPRNQRNSGKADPNLVNGNSNRKRSEFDSENNKKNTQDTNNHPTAVSRSGTFLKDEPTILKKPQVKSEV